MGILGCIWTCRATWYPVNEDPSPAKQGTIVWPRDSPGCHAKQYRRHHLPGKCSVVSTAQMSRANITDAPSRKHLIGHAGSSTLQLVRQLYTTSHVFWTIWRHRMWYVGHCFSLRYTSVSKFCVYSWSGRLCKTLCRYISMRASLRTDLLTITELCLVPYQSFTARQPCTQRIKTEILYLGTRQVSNTFRMHSCGHTLTFVLIFQINSTSTVQWISKYPVSCLYQMMCGRPTNHPSLFFDFSGFSDLPMNKLSELFNVNHFIVCQGTSAINLPVCKSLRDLNVTLQ